MLTMVRLCGAALGLFAFATTVLLGLITGNPTDEILLRAIQALFCFLLLGLFVGWVARRVEDEHAKRRHDEIFPESQNGTAASPPSSPTEPAEQVATGVRP